MDCRIIQIPIVLKLGIYDNVKFDRYSRRELLLRGKMKDNASMSACMDRTHYPCMIDCRLQAESENCG
jgi:hypothetical protein